MDLLQAMQVLRCLGPLVALETGRTGGREPGATWLALAPRCIAEFRAGGWRVQAGREPVRAPPGAAARDLFGGLEEILASVRWPPSHPDAPPVGAFGFFGYDSTAPAGAPRDPVLPDAWFLITDVVLEWRARDDVRLHGPDAALAERVCQALRAGPGATPTRRASPRRAPDAGDQDPLQYAQAFGRIRDHLRRGESYQLCYTYQIRRPYPGDPLALYRSLRRRNPAPFAACLLAPDFAVLSSSPERFLRLDHRRRVEACPMKGTARRGADARGDRRQRQALLASEKERAENLMIADLLRNELGRVCRIGSARITATAALEEHATVFQLVSRVSGELDPSRTRADLLRAAFPPGSMTGAPKQRAVELLRSLEGRPRGPYSGALGYLAADGRMDLSVLIRCFILTGGEARIGVGGGVVWDSEVAAEYGETRLKAAALLEALGDPP